MGAIQTAMTHWEYLAPVLTPPKDDTEYQQLVEDLDTVLDAGGADQNHPLAGLVDRMADLIAAYEEQHHPIEGTGTDAIKFLIQQIKGLAKRFGVAEQVFI